MDVRMFTVGVVAENCYLIRRDGAENALIVDPGDEAPKLLNAIEELGVRLDGILLTHTHFDHVGAVAPLAKATGAEVWVPEIERPVLADIMIFVPFAGIGPFESYEAEHTLSGGEKLELAGLEIDVIFTPGHSPGHVSFSIPGERALFSGDVLFQGSVGRTDLPGGDWPTLLESIRKLVDGQPEETVVYPGQGTKLMMSASTGLSISGTHTSAPVASATGATAPMWSKWVCVSRIPASSSPSASIAASSFGASSPGSTISASSRSSRRKRKQFSCISPTVNIRTSIGR